MTLETILAVFTTMWQVCVEDDADSVVDMVRRPTRRQKRVAKRKLSRAGLDYYAARDVIRASRRKDIRRALENCCGVSK